MNREHFYQKTWFKNLILIIIPSLISVLGVIISFVPESVRPILIFATIISLAILIGFVIYFGNQDDDLHKKLENQQLQNLTLTNIIAHMENLYKTNTFEISSLSNIFEVWASAINSFANNIFKTGTISNKAWDKIKYIDDICVCCRKLIEQYCNNTDDSKVFVGYLPIFYTHFLIFINYITLNIISNLFFIIILCVFFIVLNVFGYFYRI